MTEVRIVAAAAAIGMGFPDDSLAEGMKAEPHAICADAGSDDCGPYYLGSGKSFFGLPSVKHDLRRMIVASRRAGIPCVVGSAGMSGSNEAVDTVVGLVSEIANEEGLHFKVGRIYCEQDKAYLKRKLADQAIEPLVPWVAPLTESDIDASVRVVGVLGTDAYHQALDAGADVIIAGRSSDSAIYAGVATYFGSPEPLAWHVGKLVECAGACLEGFPLKDSVLATVRSDHFLIQALNDRLTASALSTAAHMFYENPSPVILREPVGTIDLSSCSYDEVDPQTVRVSGAVISERNTTIKLEAVRFVGFRTVSMGVIADQRMIERLGTFIPEIQAFVESQIPAYFQNQLTAADFKIVFHKFGMGGVWAPWEKKYGRPVKLPADSPTGAREIVVVVDVVGPTQEAAATVCVQFRQLLAHAEKFVGLPDGNAAIVFPEFQAGPVFEWSVFHRVAPAEPRDMYQMEVLTL